MISGELGTHHLPPGMETVISKQGVIQKENFASCVPLNSFYVESE